MILTATLCHEAESVTMKETKEFEDTADRHILEEDRFIKRILKDFHLEKSGVQFKEDDHYRCAVCENGSGE